MKVVLVSTCSNWCEKIVSGEATVRVCKSMPKLQTPFKVYIYCTKGKPFIQKIRFGDIAISHTQISKNLYNGKVIGEFVCDKIEVLFNTEGNPENYMTDILPNILQNTALSFKEFQDYVGSRSDKNSIYGWHISQLKIYNKPKELSEFFDVKYDTVDYCVGCPYHETPVTEYPCCDCVCEVGTRKYLTRPPMSWCYVQE